MFLTGTEIYFFLKINIFYEKKRKDTYDNGNVKKVISTLCLVVNLNFQAKRFIKIEIGRYILSKKSFTRLSSIHNFR